MIASNRVWGHEGGRGGGGVALAERRGRVDDDDDAFCHHSEERKHPFRFIDEASVEGRDEEASEAGLAQGEDRTVIL